MKAKVKAAQSSLTLHGSMDYTVYGISKARILEWVDPPPGGLLNPGIEHISHIAGGFFITES